MAAAASGRQQVEACIGKAGLPLGSLVYMKHGRRESCAFAYGESWLANPQRFSVSADLPLAAGYQSHKAASTQDSVFHGAFAAFDLNPFPDKDRESKTWLSEEDGPIADVPMLLARAPWFGLERDQALAVLDEVHAAVSNWRQVALGAEVGLRAAELDDFAQAFEHEQQEAAAALLGR